MTDVLPGTFAFIGPLELVIRLVIALAAGFLLGIDREIRHRAVGVRTYMLVSLGAAAYAIVTMELVLDTRFDGVSADPSRITQGLIGAIGFLGAGAIIQGRGRVGGLASAASLWIAGAVGMASGLGFYTHAILVAAFAAVLLAISRVMDGRGADDRPAADGDDDGAESDA